MRSATRAPACAQGNPESRDGAAGGSVGKKDGAAVRAGGLRGSIEAKAVVLTPRLASCGMRHR